MSRIPATLRSYDISTVYVLQDKVQNDITYGDKESKAILANLSYQFFGKANDPDTAKYYERFFELIKSKTKSVSFKRHTLDFDSRVTTGEKEISKIRAFEFFRLNIGEFIYFGDGEEQKIQFKKVDFEREMPKPINYTDEQLDANFKRIFDDVKSIFK